MSSRCEMSKDGNDKRCVMKGEGRKKKKYMGYPKGNGWLEVDERMMEMEDRWR